MKSAMKATFTKILHKLYIIPQRLRIFLLFSKTNLAQYIHSFSTKRHAILLLIRFGQFYILYTLYYRSDIKIVNSINIILFSIRHVLYLVTNPRSTAFWAGLTCNIV